MSTLSLTSTRHARRSVLARGFAVLVAAFLVAASAVIVASPAHAAPFTDGDFQFDNTSATEASVTGYTGAATSIVIPSTATDGVNTYTITAIADYAFDSLSLTSATIPSTVTTIGYYAFGNNLLTAIVIPSSVTTIQSQAFAINGLVQELVTVSD